MPDALRITRPDPRTSMRVAMFTNMYPPILGGVSVSVETFRRELDRLGHLVSVFAPSADAHGRELPEDEPFVFRLRALDLTEPFNLAVPLALKLDVMPILRGFKPDVVHSHHPYLIGELGAKCARELGRPLVFTYHTTYLDHASLYIRRAPRLAAQIMSDVIQNYLERCRWVIAPTPTIRDDIVRTFRLTCPISVLPTPIDLPAPGPGDRDAARKALGLSGRPVLLYVGRFSREKSMPDLLEAFVCLREREPAAHLLLIGGGPGRRSLERHIRDLGLEDAVTISGRLPRDEVAHLLAAGDVFVVSSKTETQGIAVIEAMAAGLPVVAVGVGGTRDVVTSESGILVPPDDPRAFADAVLHLLRDGPAREAMGRAAREYARQFRPEILARKLIEIYDEVLLEKAELYEK